MISNIELFEHSLNNQEPLMDDFYIKKNSLIITKTMDKQNKLMLKNNELIENISAFKIAQNKNNIEMMSSIIENIQELLSTHGMNYSEFSSFLSIVDVSYSAYSSLQSDKQIKFLKEAVEKYIDMRHPIYSIHGYTATTLQASKDAKSHKSSGSLGIIKTAKILNEFDYQGLDENELDINNFNSNDKIFIFTDKKGKKLFKEILEFYSIDFQWSSNRSIKMPDVLFKNGKDFYIVEHKHMKEGGGGQDKQVAEIIDFISHSENNTEQVVHYVTFLDGSYFNLFSNLRDNSRSKIRRQLENIKINLQNNSKNYFVNTAGFRNLLENIKESENESSNIS